MATLPVCSRSQRGISTLFVTLVLLLLSSLVVFFAARGAINEQRLSANELRTKQAFAAATAGLEHAMTHFGKSADGGLDQFTNATGVAPPDNSADPISGQSALFSGAQRPSYYEARYCDPDSAAPQCPTTHTATFSCGTALPTSKFRNPLFVACGWSDDDTAVVRLVQRAGRAPTLPGKITSPVVTKGSTTLMTGGASIFNYFNDLTIWAGGSAVTSGSMTGKTFIRDITTDQTPSPTRDFRGTSQGSNSPGCNNPWPGYDCSTDGSASGHDMVFNDTNLSTLTGDQFFAKFMTPSTPDAFRDAATWKVDLNNGMTGEDSTDINSLAGKQDAVIWVEGNVNSLSGTIGSVDKPVILVVNGDLDLGSNANIYGLVYVRGNFTSSGTPTIYGSLISQGTATGGSNLKIIYDPGVLAGSGQLGKAGKVQGSWKDWQ